MRIMLVSRTWLIHRPGGVPHVIYDRAVELARGGHDVHVVTTCATGTEGSTGADGESNESGVTVHYSGRSPSQIWSPEFAEECLAHARRLKPHVAHSDSFDNKRPWWLDLNGSQRPRVALTMHGFTLGGWLTELNLWRAGQRDDVPAFPQDSVQRDIIGMRAADVVIGVSQWERRMLRDQYGLTKAKLVYNPIAPEFFSAAPFQGERSGFLCVAVSQGGKRGFGQAQRAAERAGVELTLLSGTARRDLPNLYDRARAVVLPTAFAQGWDLSIAEGRARCCPAIVAGTGSYLDEASYEDTVVPYGDEDALVEALRSHASVLKDNGIAQKHRPDYHTARWLEAVT